MCAITIFLCLLPATFSAALDGKFPNRPVKLIVPWPAGGATDVALRALAKASEPHLGQAIVVENHPGASGTLAPISIARTAKADGYTLTQTPTSLIIAAAMKDLDLDPVSDFTYVICLTGYVFGIAVRADATWQTLQELLAEAKAKPGVIRFSSPGYGTVPHIVMMRIAKQQGVKWTHIPFGGNAGSLTALLGKHVDAIADGSAWSNLVESGQFRLLATWGAQRNENWPNVPTLKEAGIDIVANSPYSLAGPKGMRPEVVRVLHDAFRRGMQEKSYLETLKQLGQEEQYLDSRSCRNAALKQFGDKRKILRDLNIAK